MKIPKHLFILALVPLLAGCASDSDRADDSSTVPSMESIPSPNPTANPSTAQQDSDSHGWGTSIQNVSTGRQ